MKAKDQIKLMGKKVIVLFELERRYKEDGLRVWESKKLDKPKVGWIVGFRHLLNGKRVGGNFNGEDGYETGYLKEVLQRSLAIMVVYWPTKAPVPVPPGGYFLDNDDIPVKSPYAWEGQWSENFKAQLREIMAKIPRDSKGRWKKE